MEEGRKEGRKERRFRRRRVEEGEKFLEEKGEKIGRRMMEVTRPVESKRNENETRVKVGKG